MKRGEIRWYRFAQPDKKRPALILTRSSIIDYLGEVTVAPITSTVRGVRSEAPLGAEDGMKGPCVVNAHNLLTVRKDQVGRRVARLSETRMGSVCGAIAFALGCD